MRKFKYSAIIVFFSFIFSAFTACQNNEGISSISAQEFKEDWKDKQYTLLDVRSQGEFKEGYIKDAILIPVNSNDFKKKALELPKDKPIVIYCHAGPRANQAASVLQQEGFKNIYLLDGSFSAWQDAGLPVEK
ncbi:MAG: rhodanese-like domain-containing protein [Chitinophagales bacterium]